MFKKLSIRLSFFITVIMLIILTCFTIFFIRERTDRLYLAIMKRGRASAHLGSKVVSKLLDNIVESGVFSVEEVFDNSLVKIQLPEKIIKGYGNVSEANLKKIEKYHYKTTLDSYLESKLLEVLDGFLKDNQIVFAILVDNNGYVPVHNSRYSMPLKGDFIYDRNNNRTKRLFNDVVGLKAAKNTTADIKKQLYRRDTGEIMWDVSSPVYVKGRHWGSFRIGFSLTEILGEIKDLRNKLIISMSLLMMICIIFINRITAYLMISLGQLHKGVKKVSEGDLNYKHQIISNDEIGELASAFNIMVDDLNTYMDNLKKTTAMKERIESELSVARAIQMDIVPKLFPAYPNRDEFDIYAFIEPARSVGGDLYDFFFIDDDHLMISVGDVSGKGIPASLFMAVTQTLIRSTSMSLKSPEKVLKHVNAELSRNNRSCMFVTLFLCLMDLKTGIVSFSNAGHNMPINIQKNGDVEYIKCKPACALGVVDDMEFNLEELKLKKEESLFIYTDGVTEAMNSADELFGDDRLLKEIGIIGKEPIESIIGEIAYKVKTFADGCPQSDDITMLAVKYIGA